MRKDDCPRRNAFSLRELRNQVAAGVWESMQRKHGFEFSPESRNNLDRLNRILNYYPAVVYCNHTSMDDARVAVSLVLSGLPDAKRILGPAGMKHYDLKRDPKNGLLLRGLRLAGIQILPVVQADDEKDYGSGQREMLDRLKERTAKTILLPGSVYGIAPEGTRNNVDGSLQRAKKGIGYLAEYDLQGDSIYYLPMFIGYPKYTGSPQVAVGEPRTMQEIVPAGLEMPLERRERAQAVADLHMARLAEMMPDYLQGVYGLGV